MSSIDPKTFVPCAPGWSVHVRGPVGQEDGSTKVEDSYWPVVGWVVSFPDDVRDEIEPVFLDPTVPDTMSLSAWKKAYATTNERYEGVVPTAGIPH